MMQALSCFLRKLSGFLQSFPLSLDPVEVALHELRLILCKQSFFYTAINTLLLMLEPLSNTCLMRWFIVRIFGECPWTDKRQRESHENRQTE